MPTTDHALAEGSIAQVSGEGGEKGGRSGLDAGPGRPRRESVREICSPAQLFFLPRPIARRFAENESEYQLAPLALQNLRRTQLPQAIWDARNDLQWKENFIQRLKLPGTAATPTTDDETIERFYAEGIGTGTESKSACSLAKRELIRFLRRRIQQPSRRNVECSSKRLRKILVPPESCSLFPCSILLCSRTLPRIIDSNVLLFSSPDLTTTDTPSSFSPSATRESSISLLPTSLAGSGHALYRASVPPPAFVTVAPQHLTSKAGELPPGSERAGTGHHPSTLEYHRKTEASTRLASGLCRDNKRRECETSPLSRRERRTSPRVLVSAHKRFLDAARQMSSTRMDNSVNSYASSSGRVSYAGGGGDGSSPFVSRGVEMLRVVSRA